MWNGYYYKLIDSWTSALFWAPRWFNANSYSHLTEAIEIPLSLTTQATSLLTISTQSIIPSSWILTTASVSSTGNTLQRFFECFTNEKEHLLPSITSAYYSRQLFFDVYSPQYAWVFESEERVKDVSVLTTIGTSAVKFAQSDLDLFFSGGWAWRQTDNCIMLYGLDIQPLTDFVTGGWHFVHGVNKTGSGGFYYIEHLHTKNWYPLSPAVTRSDGFLSIYTTGSVRIRGHSSTAAKSLSSVLLVVDGSSKIARRVELFNSVDERALYFNLSRRYSESNNELAQALLTVSWFRGQSLRSVRSSVSASLRQGNIVNVSASSTSFTIPATATGFDLRKIPLWIYRTEVLTVGGSSLFLTNIASADYGCAYLNNIPTLFSVSSSIVTFQSYTNPLIDRPHIHWKLPMVSQISSSQVNLSENIPHTDPDLVVFFPRSVDVNRPSLSTLKKSFLRTSPNIKWQKFDINETVLAGLSTFDF